MMDTRQDIAAFINDGALDLSALRASDARLLTSEFMPGHEFLLDLGLALDGEDAMIYLEPGQIAFPQLAVSFPLDSASSLKALPAILALARELRFCEGVITSAQDEADRRRSFLRTAAFFYADPAAILSSTGLREEALTGEELFLLGLLPVVNKLSAQEVLTYAREYGRQMRESFIPWGFSDELKDGKRRDVGYSAMPDEFSLLACHAGVAQIVRSLSRAELLLDAVTFALSEGYGSFQEFIASTSKLDKVRLLAAMHRVPDFLTFAWERSDWWALAPAGIYEELGGFTARQMSGFVARAQGCHSPGALLLLIRLITDQVLPLVAGCLAPPAVAWCADPGLTDWVTGKAHALLGAERVRELFREATALREATGEAVPAAAWANMFQNLDELASLPVSWWSALGQE